VPDALAPPDCSPSVEVAPPEVALVSPPAELVEALLPEQAADAGRSERKIEKRVDRRSVMADWLRKKWAVAKPVPDKALVEGNRRWLCPTGAVKSFPTHTTAILVGRGDPMPPQYAQFQHMGSPSSSALHRVRGTKDDTFWETRRQGERADPR
jgi:hypothetical protein